MTAIPSPSEDELHTGLGILESSRIAIIELLEPLVGTCTYDELVDIARIIRKEREAAIAHTQAQTERAVIEAKADAYADCASKGGNGKEVRAYAKSRELLLEAQLTNNKLKEADDE